MDKLIIILLAVVYFLGPVREVRADGWIRHEFRPGLNDSAIQGLVERPGGGAPMMVRDGRSMEASASTPPPEGKLHRASPSPRHRPDRATDFTDELAYFETYQPGVAPHKRLAALDAVEFAPDGTPELILASRARLPVPIGGVEGKGDRFIGEVWVDLSGGVSVPIPSVSPNMRILHLASAPSAPLEIERDGAGNYYLSAGIKIDEPVHVLLFVEADPGYFNQPIPDLPLASLNLGARPLPRSLEREALAFAAELGLSPQSSLKEALEVLVEYFRAFIEGETQRARGASIYSDLARGGYGICRHRAYAFMITALALGIPARYVQNEAHAFVEVDLPSEDAAAPSAPRSMRIELGGSTAFVEGHGLRADRMYRPRHPDPFPQPEAYLESIRRGSIPSESAAAEPAAAAIEPAKRSRYRATIIDAELDGYRGERMQIVLQIVDREGRPAAELALNLRAGETLLARGLSDESGKIRFSLRIPFEIEPGTHKLELLARSGTDSPQERIPIDVK